MTTPKTSQNIVVSEKKTALNSTIGEVISELQVPLSTKIDEYILKLGYSNAHVLGILVQLLTNGKVRVDFRDYAERLSLITANDRMTRGDAVELFDEHLKTMNSHSGAAGESNVTQKIVVQMPKVQLPKTF
jgi:hypothetical protein